MIGCMIKSLMKAIRENRNTGYYNKVDKDRQSCTDKNPTRVADASCQDGNDLSAD
jgi:hypothetical protein